MAKSTKKYPHLLTVMTKNPDKDYKKYHQFAECIIDILTKEREGEKLAEYDGDGHMMDGSRSDLVFRASYGPHALCAIKHTLKASGFHGTVQWRKRVSL